MKSNWRDAVSDPTDRKVIESLDDPRWDFRTVPGLATSTGLPEHIVRDVLSRYPQVIRRSPVPDSQGRELYTLVSKGGGLREWYARTRAFITKSIA
ncbi:MAG TPA: hypothetical protein VK548_26095 [Candidatus Acidoferrum sp.]|nr:hypothetical protein [Candidatus Acidoferrum sp.]